MSATINMHTHVHTHTLGRSLTTLIPVDDTDSKTMCVRDTRSRTRGEDDPGSAETGSRQLSDVGVKPSSCNDNKKKTDGFLDMPLV